MRAFDVQKRAMLAAPIAPFIREADRDTRERWVSSERRLLDYLVVMVERGRCRFEVEDRLYCPGPDQVFLVQPGDRVRMEGLTETVTPYIHFDMFAQPDRGGRFPTGPGFLDLGAYRHLMQPRLSDILKCSLSPLIDVPDPAYFHEHLVTCIRSWQSVTLLNQLESHAILHELIVIMLRAYHSDRPVRADLALPLRRLDTFLHRHLHEPVSVQAMSQSAGVSAQHLARLCRFYWHQAPHQRLLYLRLQHSPALLRNPDLSIAQVAEYCGFADAQHFGHMFRKCFACTPGAARGSAAGRGDQGKLVGVEGHHSFEPMSRRGAMASDAEATAQIGHESRAHPAPATACPPTGLSERIYPRDRTAGVAMTATSTGHAVGIGGAARKLTRHVEGVAMQSTPADLQGLSEFYPLVSTQIARFRRDGHILLRGVASDGVVATYRPAISDAVFRLTTETRPLAERDTYGKAFLQVMNIWEQDQAVRQFVLAKRYAKIAADLMGVTGVRVFHDQALFKEPGGGITPWHQDQIYWPLDTANTITMWMPLVNIPASVGSMTFVSGSHALDYRERTAISDRSEEILRQFVEDYALPQSTYGSMAAGDATFHSGWTMHRAPANPTDTLREVMTIIYFEDGVHLLQQCHPLQEEDFIWFPGARPGDLAAGARTPLAYSQQWSGEQPSV